jgi:type IV secretion system protein TrbJ
MRRRSFLLTLVALPSAKAGIVGGFATEWTQLQNKIQILLGYIRQGEELRQKILMVLDMAKHTAKLPFQIFAPIMADIASLHGVVRQGRALAYSMANLDAEFAARFKGFSYRPEQWYQEYQEWSRTTLDTALGTLKAANIQANQMMNEEAVLAQIRRMSESSDGRLKAVQVGLQLSEQTVQQMMKLRQIMLADIQSKQAYQAWQMQQSANAQAAERRFFERGSAGRQDPNRFLGGNQ